MAYGFIKIIFFLNFTAIFVKFHYLLTYPTVYFKVDFFSISFNLSGFQHIFIHFFSFLDVIFFFGLVGYKSELFDVDEDDNFAKKNKQTKNLSVSQKSLDVYKNISVIIT